MCGSQDHNPGSGLVGFRSQHSWEPTFQTSAIIKHLGAFYPVKNEELLVFNFENNKNVNDTEQKGGSDSLISSHRITELCIADFGGSCRMKSHGQYSGLIGTIGSLAPELLNGKPTNYDAKIDSWALGVILY